MTDHPMTDEAGTVQYEALWLDIPENLDLDGYRQVAQAIGHSARGHQWWAGDLLVHAEEHLGEDEWPQIEADLGVEPKTGLNWRYVAGRVHRERRRTELYWSHHAEVARLDAADQAALLAEAIANDWSVRQLRDVVALRLPQPKQERLETDPPEEDPVRELRAILEEIVTAFKLTKDAGDTTAKRNARKRLADAIARAEEILNS